MSSRPLVFALLAAVALGACAPVPVLQDATVLRPKRSRSGFAGAAFVPTRADTRWKPDGYAMDRGQPELRWLPLAYFTGWYRQGLASGTELQAACQLPSFTTTLAGKLGLFGQDADAPVSAAIAGDLSGSLLLADFGIGGTLYTSVRLGPETSLDSSGRFGTFPGLWRLPAVTTTIGVSLGRDDTIHIALGGVIPVLGGESAPGLWLAVGHSD